MILDKPKLIDIQNIAQNYIKPNQWIWLIVGDLKKIEQPIRNLELGKVTILD